MAGTTVVGREAVLPVVDDGSAIRHVYLSSTSRLPPKMGGGVLVILQDITDLQRLPGLIAICAQCKQVRHDGAWLPLDRYVQTQSHALFTHTLCPTCSATCYPEMGEEAR